MRRIEFRQQHIGGGGGVSDTGGSWGRELFLEEMGFKFTRERSVSPNCDCSTAVWLQSDC